jgi:organic hydroperoxide reductase OsmC/OhrA
MKPLPHHYTVRLPGGPTGYASATVDGMPALRTAPPTEFDGPGDAWSPEHLLLASVETCFLFTFRAAARAARVEFTACDVTAEGTVDRDSPAIKFTEILLRVRLGLPPDGDRDRARRAIEKAERACLVSASLATPVRLELDFA